MLRWEDRADGRWIRLRGELDHEGCAEVATPFDELVDGGAAAVVADLSDVTFVGSDGLRLLLRVHQRLTANGRVLRVAGLAPGIRSVFETTGLFAAIPEHRPGT